MSESKLKVIFIGGSSRSGSTLLDRILGQIDGFFSLGETYHIWERSFIENQLCGCGTPFKSCDFWKAVVEKAFGGLDHVDGEAILKLQRSVARIRHTPQLAFPKLRSQRFRSALSEYVEILERLYRAIAKTSGCKVLIDSSKVPPHGFILCEMSNVDLYVVHLVRDSRAVAYSWQRKKRRPEIHWKEAYMPKLGFLKAAQLWMLSNWLVGLLSRKVPKYKIVNYETLASNPRSTITKILEWMGMDSANLDFFDNERVVRLGVDHTVSGNPIRFKQGKIEIRPDREWSEKMSFPKKFLVSVLTYPVLRRYQRARTSVWKES